MERLPREQLRPARAPLHARRATKNRAGRSSSPRRPRHAAHNFRPTSQPPRRLSRCGSPRPRKRARQRIIRHVSAALGRPLRTKPPADWPTASHGTAGDVFGALFDLEADLSDPIGSDVRARRTHYWPAAPPADPPPRNHAGRRQILPHAAKSAEKRLPHANRSCSPGRSPLPGPRTGRRQLRTNRPAPWAAATTPRSCTTTEKLQRPSSTTLADPLDLADLQTPPTTSQPDPGKTCSLRVDQHQPVSTTLHRKPLAASRLKPSTLDQLAANNQPTQNPHAHKNQNYFAGTNFRHAMSSRSTLKRLIQILIQT